MKQKYQNLLCIIGIMLFAAILLEVRFQIYKHQGIENDESLVLVDENLSINYLDGNKIKGTGTIKVNFSVTNVSDHNIDFFISLNNIMNDTEDLTFSIKSSNKGYDKDYEPIVGSDHVIGSNIPIKPNESIRYDLFINNAKHFKAIINIGYEKDYVNLLKDLIIASNNINQDTDNDGDTYYFKNNVNNNFVSIDDLLFRIIRVNGDGTIRVMMDQNIGNHVFLNNTGKPYLDYKSSDINEYLQSYYQNNLAKYDALFSMDNFCIDTVVFNSVGDKTYFENYYRIDNNEPNYKCSTIYQSKIGLLNGDEAMFAGSTKSDTSYLKKKDEIFYTMSYAYTNNGNFPSIVVVDNGKLSDKTSDNELSVYPVLNLSKDVLAIGGGTFNNPYQIIYQK
ncbi:MAG: hypothetical protein J5892_00975 [Bacilli bacterium]|nr:hypothetical protein [Bacilli bacterium]